MQEHLKQLQSGKKKGYDSEKFYLYPIERDQMAIQYKVSLKKSI